MDYIDSIQLSLSRYFDISSKADRKEFWFFFLFYIVGVIASVLIDHFAGTLYHLPFLVGSLNIGIFCGVFILLVTIPYITVGIRRLHDAGFSKWLILLTIVPFGNIALIILWAMKSRN